MRNVALALAMFLATVPAFAQSQTPGPDTSRQRHEAVRDFGRAGGSAAQTARQTGHGLAHGWQVTKQAVTSGWNRVTGNGDAK
jgi:hypothetical protein